MICWRAVRDHGTPSECDATGRRNSARKVPGTCCTTIGSPTVFVDRMLDSSSSPHCCFHCFCRESAGHRLFAWTIAPSRIYDKDACRPGPRRPRADHRRHYPADPHVVDFPARCRQPLSRGLSSTAAPIMPRCSRPRDLIAKLEGAEEAFLFGSGMAAASERAAGARKADPHHRLESDVLGLPLLAARDRPLRPQRQLCRDLRS